MLDLYDNHKDWYAMSDRAIIRQLGAFIKEQRLRKNYTQNELAEKSGIHRVTLSEFEQGLRGSLSTFIQLLRALGALGTLDVFVLPVSISPLEMARLEAKKRKRASTPHKKKPAAKPKPPGTSKIKRK